jgi:hypothetical protein
MDTENLKRINRGDQCFCSAPGQEERAGDSCNCICNHILLKPLGSKDEAVDSEWLGTIPAERADVEKALNARCHRDLHCWFWAELYDMPKDRRSHNLALQLKHGQRLYPDAGHAPTAVALTSAYGEYVGQLASDQAKLVLDRMADGYEFEVVVFKERDDIDAVLIPRLTVVVLQLKREHDFGVYPLAIGGDESAPASNGESYPATAVASRGPSADLIVRYLRSTFSLGESSIASLRKKLGNLSVQSNRACCNDRDVSDSDFVERLESPQPERRLSPMRSTIAQK